MNILCTGASGFIGSHLCKKLSENHKVVALIRDVVPSKWLDEALKNCVHVRGDIRNFSLLKRVINQYEVDHVYHLAAQSIVKRAYKDSINTFETNVLGTVKLLEACRQLDVKKILVQSTDKVYGNQVDATSESELKPTEPYGASKIAMDVATQSFAETYGMNVIISRSCNCYGLDYANRIVPNTIRACLRGESPIIYRNDDSQRQYVYVEDLVSALIYVMEYLHGIVNIATPDVLTQKEVVLKILQLFPSLQPKYVEKPKLKEIKSQSMIPTDFGWEPKYMFERGIEETIRRFRRYGF